MGTRRHQARRVDTGTPDWANLTRCPACGKKSYATRKAAKNAAKVHHQDAHMSVYRCRSNNPKRPNPAPWHYGHLDEAVISGKMSKDEVYVQGKKAVPRHKTDPQALEAIRKIASSTNSPR